MKNQKTTKDLNKIQKEINDLWCLLVNSNADRFFLKIVILIEEVVKLLGKIGKKRIENSRNGKKNVLERNDKTKGTKK